MSNGPFQLSSWRPDSELVVTKNPNYWGAARVKLREIHFHAMADVSAQERATTDAERWAAFDRLEALIASEMPYLPLYHPHRTRLVHIALHGWRENGFGIIDWRELWLEAPK